jgi:hypothetical protein
MIPRSAFPLAAALLTVIGGASSASAETCYEGSPVHGGRYSPTYDGCSPASHRWRLPKVCENCYLKPLRRAEYYNWNRNYAHVQYGQPIALVVPPTANLKTDWGWGVSSFRLSRLDHQFGRNWPGPGPIGGPFKNTPPWPSDTNQFGVYHVRGPW